MSLGTHTRHFGTRVVQTNNVHLAPRILEVETNKQTALQWYHMQRALRENSPRLSYADVVKKQSTSLDKQLSKTLPQKQVSTMSRLLGINSRKRFTIMPLQIHNLMVTKDYLFSGIQKNPAR